jgi:hypothetical protein
MIGKPLAIAATLLLSTQVYAQSNQGGTHSAPGVTSGPAAGSPTTMTSPHAGALETKHQRNVVHEQSQSVRHKKPQAAGQHNDETGATGSSSPTYAPPPR